jgi:DNA-binding transcriptional ArsR family regulator
VSRHLSILKNAGLITDRKDANRILHTLAADRGTVRKFVCDVRRGPYGRDVSPG